MRTRTKKAVEGGGGLFRAGTGQRGEPEARATGIAAALDALGGSGGAIAGVFRRMSIVEEALKARWPGGKKGGEPPEAFVLCCPTSPLSGCIEDVYRAHVNELLDRLKETRDGSRLGRLTRAEVMMLLSASSLRHPLAHADTLLFERLFRELLPEHAERALERRTLLAGEELEVHLAMTEWLNRPSPERVESLRKLREEQGAIRGT
jgi:hypothetical protein